MGVAYPPPPFIDFDGWGIIDKQWMFYDNSSVEAFQCVSKYTQILPFKIDYLLVVRSTTKLEIFD